MATAHGKKSALVATRISEDLRARLDAVHGRYRTNDSDIVSELLRSFVEAVEAVDAVRFPIAIAMAGAKDISLMAAEDAGEYNTTKGKGAGPPLRRRRGAGPQGALSA